VERWRRLFDEVRRYLNEIDGIGTAIQGPKEKVERAARVEDKAKKAPSFEMCVENQTITIPFSNISTLTVSYFLANVEIVFSTNPFMAKNTDNFQFVKPKVSQVIFLCSSLLSLPSSSKTNGYRRSLTTWRKRGSFPLTFPWSFVT